MKKFLQTFISLGFITALLSSSLIPANAATVKGDVNADNSITLQDASMVQEIAVGLRSPNKNEEYSADFNGDGNINLTDAYLIQKLLIGDSTVNDKYMPNKAARIDVINLLNEDRKALNLQPLEFSDASLTAGQIRVEEYSQGYFGTRPNGSQFTTVFSECNLKGNEIVQYTAQVRNNAKSVYDYIKENNPDIYRDYLMSPNYHTICVGSMPCPQSRNLFQWVICLG